MGTMARWSLLLKGVPEPLFLVSSQSEAFQGGFQVAAACTTPATLDSSPFWGAHHPRDRRPRDSRRDLGAPVKGRQLEPGAGPCAVQRIPECFYEKDLRKCVLVDIGLTMRTECIFGSLFRPGRFTVTLFSQTGGSEMGEVALSGGALG